MKREFRYFLSDNPRAQSPAELLRIEAESVEEIPELLKAAGCDGVWVHVLVWTGDGGTDRGFEVFHI